MFLHIVLYKQLNYLFQRSESSSEPVPPAAESNNAVSSDSEDIILQTDVSSWLLLKGTTKDGTEVREVRGGHPDALIVLATKATKGTKQIYRLSFHFLHLGRGHWTNDSWYHTFAVIKLMWRRVFKISFKDNKSMY